MVRIITLSLLLQLSYQIFIVNYSVKKIVIIGPESTGKSTLCKALAQKLNTVWVKEYAREYLELQNNHYDYNDLLTIAKGQINKEEQKIALAHKVLFCDTDLYVLMVWCHQRFGKVHPYILEEIAERKYDAYILCGIDMPWSEDPMREHPEPEMRRYFYGIYKDIVVHSGLPFIMVWGNEQQRLEQALNSGLFGTRQTQNK